MLDGLRAGLKAKLPQIDKAQDAAFLAPTKGKEHDGDR